ncbi:DnaJ like chaperone protein [Ferrimonas sediminum]|uniref:Co-chaperone protein DjlA n=1 Tax=Ferrimonas sediminum TaxID=718193 RepID=A0A1G8V261_9GAMM|nr:co-chaperone DjlA [Ferrimonas sediminum]SDJ59240.1 DnaJ like chaperone protein [Ferrimonas sediminum]
MQIWGKVFGGLLGFFFGRIAGMIFGAWLGHILVDKRRTPTSGPRQNLFFHTTFAVMGHVAKASGQVTSADIALASAVMDQLRLSGDARREAQAAFREGKAADYPLQERLKQLKLVMAFRRDLARMFLEIQIQIALSDGSIDDKERAILMEIARQLGFSPQELEQMLSMWQGEHHYRASGSQGPSLDDAYRLLGVSADDDDRQIKRAYRKQMAQHHPDKLASQGLPEEMMTLARQKSQDIQAAWEVVRSERKLR